MNKRRLEIRAKIIWWGYFDIQSQFSDKSEKTTKSSSNKSNWENNNIDLEISLKNETSIDQKILEKEIMEEINITVDSTKKDVEDIIINKAIEEAKKWWTKLTTTFLKNARFKKTFIWLKIDSNSDNVNLFAKAFNKQLSEIV